MVRYSEKGDQMLKRPKEAYTNVEAVKEFRSQRNLYITGMSLFLMFVIRRLVVLLTTTASLIQDLDRTERDNEALKNELATVLEAKIRLSKTTTSEDESKTGGEAEIIKGELSDKEELRSRSKTRVKKEI